MGSGSFTVRVAAEDTGSGLDQAEYPETTSPGGVYGTALGGDYQYEHTYTFDQADTASGTYTVTLQDGIGRQSSVGFGVIRDTTPPTLTLAALVQGDVHVTWSATDPDSGVDASTCLLEVREDEGAWQPFSTECVGDDTHDGQPGHTYTFRLSASDNVANAASLEVQAVFPYVKKYYYANGQRIATRVDGSLYYVHSDLLGSTMAVSNAAGQPLSRSHYLPYGEVYKSEYWDGNQWQEYDPANTPIPETDYLHTGHLLDRNTNLYYYGGGRYYDPALAHFTTPSQYTDAPFNPQNLNRYGFRLGNPLRYAQIGERYLFDRGAGTAVADVLPPDTFTAGFGRVVSAQPSTLTGVDLEDMVTSVPLGLHVRLLKTLKKLPAFRSAYRMARGGFNVVWAGEYVPGSSKVLVYGNLAIRQKLGIPPTLSHGGARAWAKYRELGRWTMGFGGAMMMSLRAARWWIIGPAILVNAYEYSPWGPKADIGYGTECLAAVTVDIALATASTLAGWGVYAFILALGGPPSWALAGGTVAFLAALWIAPMYLKEPLVEAVDRIYQELISTKPSLLRY